MADSPLHKLARLRKIAGLSQPALAKLINRSVHTVQAIEQNKLKMSKDLADRISLETGVSLDWLLDEDPRTAIVDRDLHAYSRVAFDELRESFQPIKTPKTKEEMAAVAAEIYDDVLTTLLIAMRKGQAAKALSDFGWNRDVLKNKYGNGLSQRRAGRRAK